MILIVFKKSALIDVHINMSKTFQVSKYLAGPQWRCPPPSVPSLPRAWGHVPSCPPHATPLIASQALCPLSHCRAAFSLNIRSVGQRV